jgi:hypothetical protein
MADRNAFSVWMTSREAIVFEKVARIVTVQLQLLFKDGTSKDKKQNRRKERKKEELRRHATHSCQLMYPREIW